MSEKLGTVLVPGRINPRVPEQLAQVFEVVTASQAPSADIDPAVLARIRGVALSGKFANEWFDLLPNLQVIANFGVGYDGVDTAKAAERGIVVTNTPDVLNDEVADTAIALLLNTVRRLPQAETWLREGRWKSEGPFPLVPLSLKGRHVGIVGLGRIGREIASRLEPFKVRIGYHTRTPREGLPYTHYASLKAMAEEVDTLISVLPGTAETHRIFNAEIFSALGPEGVFINVGRGTSVDEDALIAALRSGTIAGAGLDVFYDEPNAPAELLEFPNVSLLPHVASASVPTRNAMADLVVNNLIGWFREGQVLTPVPETPVRRG
ncbi:2-hydroxyacid dehydrogenase [Rhizobium sp. LC145]|uniref:2-hydroxyacid dehydrogenase n=1 Tax=Rhizobium sp. LC145 TaxID=1120688 RepID=UPI00062A47C3|nr:2-hydroxyacid dehydrogenase [Rhizobium sp. LC145]KKX30515.1 dehydrogenase [Rhizobium sp. LC145]TKT46505.1 2-hydroxyacid dehydrogenase [Rhizobiaceae bacterium LC148]